MYELYIITSGGSINDTFRFDTSEEAREEMEFYKNFYSDRKFKYKIVKEEINICQKLNYLKK